MRRIGLTEMIDNLPRLDNWGFVRMARELSMAGAEKISETTGTADALVFLQAMRDAATEAEAKLTGQDLLAARMKEKADRYFQESRRREKPRR